MNFAVDTEWRLAMSGSAEAIQAAGKKPIWPINGPGPARLRLNQACRLEPGQIRENFDIPGPLGTLVNTKSRDITGTITAVPHVSVPKRLVRPSSGPEGTDGYFGIRPDEMTGEDYK